MNKNVYLAGKISKNDWRHTIFPSLYRREIDTENQLDISIDGFNYIGPHFIGDDHGSFHGEGTHGRGVGTSGSPFNYTRGNSAATVVNKCFNWIRKSNYIFTWLDKEDAYGTIVELGYAKALDIPIFLAISNDLENSQFEKDIWFAQTMSNWVVFAENAKEAWEHFLSILKLNQNEPFSYITDKAELRYLRTKTSEYGNIATRGKTVEEINNIDRDSLLSDMWYFYSFNYRYKEFPYVDKLKSDLKIELDYKLIRGYLKNTHNYEAQELAQWTIEGTGLIYNYPVNYERENARNQTNENKVESGVERFPVKATEKQLSYIEVLARKIGYQLNQRALSEMTLQEASGIIGNLKTKSIIEDNLCNQYFLPQIYKYDSKEVIAILKKKVGKPVSKKLYNVLMDEYDAKENIDFSDTEEYFTEEWINTLVNVLSDEENYKTFKTQTGKKSK